MIRFKNGVEVSADRKNGTISFRWDEGSRGISFSPVGIGPIILVLRGMSEQETIGDGDSFAHRLDGGRWNEGYYVLRVGGEAKRFNMTEALVLSLAVEHALPDFL